jgi:anthranilate/para-aminobenzoate synthase component I
MNFCSLNFSDFKANLQDPLWIVKLENGLLELVEGDIKTTLNEDPLTILKDLWEKRIKGQNKILVGFLAYDFAPYFEPAITLKKNKLINYPELFFCAYDLDNIASKKHTINHPEGEAKLNVLVNEKEYLDMINEALEEIRKGNVYEINLSHPLQITFPMGFNEWEFFKKVIKENSVPFGAYFEIDKNRQLLSFSPECFLRKRGNSLSTFPIKGTRKRSQNEQEDNSMKRELHESSKEMAEHLMVVDLERNDLGRIAKPGTVKVKNNFSIQSFQNLHHMVTEVSCELDTNKDIFDALKHTFPSGSITGAPKVSAMKLIDKLERYSRQAYTGCFGYIDNKGDAEFSILIRSLFKQGNTGVFNVGGGIVYESNPHQELEETFLKAKFFMEAID